MVSRGISTSNILKGIHESMGGRYLRLLQSGGATGVMMVTGGLAADVGLVAAMREGAVEAKMAGEIPHASTVRARRRDRRRDLGRVSRATHVGERVVLAGGAHDGRRSPLRPSLPRGQDRARDGGGRRDRLGDGRAARARRGPRHLRRSGGPRRPPGTQTRAVDLADPAALARLVEGVKADPGRLDVLVHAAASRPTPCSGSSKSRRGGGSWR